MSVHYTDVNPDPVASGIVQSFGTGGPFAFNQVTPIVPVAGKVFRYWKWTFEDMIAAHHDTRMPDTGPANVRVHRRLTTGTAICGAHGLKEQFSDIDRNEARLIGMEEAHVSAIWEDLVREIQLGIELELKAALDAATHASTMTSTKQWNATGATIELTFDEAIKGMRHACGHNPTHVLVPEDCWEYLKRDSSVRDAIRYTNPSILDGRGGIPEQIFGVRLIVPTALQNSAVLGATASIAEIWSSDKVYFLHVNPGISTNRKLMTSTYLAQAGTLPGMTWSGEEWRPYDRDQKYTNYAVMENHKLMTQDEAIFRLDDVLA